MSRVNDAFIKALADQQDPTVVKPKTDDDQLDGDISIANAMRPYVPISRRRKTYRPWRTSDKQQR